MIGNNSTDHFFMMNLPDLIAEARRGNAQAQQQLFAKWSRDNVCDDNVRDAWVGLVNETLSVTWQGFGQLQRQ